MCKSGSFVNLCNPSSLLSPTKFVPQSERNCLAGPRIAKNLRRALMQLEVSISITSMWTAWVLIEEKSTAQRLLWPFPPLVLRVVTVKGPNTSRPTYGNGGDVLNCSSGRSAITCCWFFPRSFLHTMHL